MWRIKYVLHNSKVNYSTKEYDTYAQAKGFCDWFNSSNGGIYAEPEKVELTEPTEKEGDNK